MEDKQRQIKEKQENEGFSNSSDSQESIQCPHFHDDHLREEENSPGKKEKLPSPQKIADRRYSLQPDRITGWKSRLELPTPIPLFQCNPFIDPLLKKLSDPLVYLGPRYPTTFECYENKQFINPYEHIKKTKLQCTNRQFSGNCPNSDNCLLFDSQMEEGNLDAAVKVGQDQYELFLRVDANTKGHIQWFYFSVRRMKKGKKYKFHICNLQKHHSLYTRGGKPYVFSQKSYDSQGIGWQQQGEDLKYKRKPTESAKIAKIQVQPMYTLTFTFSPVYENDTVSFAYSIPYTYSQLERFLTDVKKKKPFICQNKLCSSLSGLNVPLLTIHERSESSTQNKKCILVSGRAHPGQSNGSYMMEGFIRFLTGNTREAIILRKQIVFKIVPMLNPDGVVLGNHRTGLSGKDFNREFKGTDGKLFPQVDSLKKLILSCKQEYKENLLMFLDFHGHSSKKNVFMYGPEFSIIDRQYYSSRVFPKLLGDCTKMFRYHSCIFKISDLKTTTARAVVLQKMNIPNSYTLQASNSCYYDHDLKKDVPFDDCSWMKMGQSVGESIFQFLSIQCEKKNRIDRQGRQFLRKRKKSDQFSKKFRIEKEKTENKQGSSVQQMKDIISVGSIKNEKKIYQQIHHLEEIREHKNEDQSDANISQGSSDKQDEIDNLDKEKMDFLYNLVKKKTKESSEKDILSFISDKLWTNRDIQRLWTLKKQQLTKYDQKPSKKQMKSYLHRQTSQEKYAEKYYLQKKNFSFLQNSKQLNILNIQKRRERKQSFGSAALNGQEEFPMINPITDRGIYNKLQTQRSLNKTHIQKLNDRGEIFMPNQKGSQYKKRRKSFYSPNISTEIQKEYLVQANPLNKKMVYIRKF